MKQARLLNYVEPRANYNDGISMSIGEWRKKIIARDNNKCQNCFNVVKRIFKGKKLNNIKKHINQAHHIIPRHHGGRNTMNNGITLCRFCHYYFDRMYFAYGMDYWQVIGKKSRKERMIEIKKLLVKNYKNRLLNIIKFI